jgi:hypothetical protein
VGIFSVQSIGPKTNNMEIIIPFIAWQLLAMSLGVMEGAFFGAARGQVEDDIHQYFWTPRTIGAMSILAWLIAEDVSWFIVPMNAAAYVLVFPFWHDGMYYVAYSWLNPEPYPRRFFDQSTTTSADISFAFPLRLILFIAGVSIITLSILI